MKHKMRTKEWLADTRKRCGLTLPQLAELSGVHSQTIYSIESGVSLGAASTWSKLDKVLYEYAPAAYVDEERLIEAIRALEDKGSHAGDLCRLYYAVGLHGVTFTNVRSVRDEDFSAPSAVLSLAHAIELLEAQKQAFERE